ncbi:MAG: CHAT domain-containing protein [Bacteroidota bacterium]
MTYHKAIKKDLRNTKIEKALEKLEALLNLSNQDELDMEFDELENIIIQYMSMYNRNETRRKKGISIQQDYDIENARIGHKILEILKEIPDKPYSSGATPPPLVDNSGTTIGTQINQPVVNGDLKVGGDHSSKAQTGGSTKTNKGPIKILMLTSNPSDTVKLNLDREHSRINSELEDKGSSAEFKLYRQRDTTIMDLTKSIVKHDPHIVHFSGHGQDAKAAVEIDESDPLAEVQPDQKGGLMFQQIEGHESKIVDAKTLQFLFKSFTSTHKVPIKVVMLNACHASEQAAAIGSVVDYVIGTNDAIMDEAAWTFSTGFYHILMNHPAPELNDELVRQAFSLGQMNAVLQGEPIDRFQLYIRGELQA